MDDNIEVIVTGVVRDEGTIVVFSGVTSGGTDVTFGVDHRIAQGLVGELGDEDVTVYVAPWRILAGAYLNLADSP